MHEGSSSLRDDDSYMCWKLLEFLRVSSLDPEFLIQCPDPVNEFSCMAAKSASHWPFSMQAAKSASHWPPVRSPRDLIGESESVRNHTEFQYCPEFQNFRTPPQRLTRIPASVAEGGMVGQEFPRVRARATRCLLYTSPSPRDLSTSRMPSSA